MRLRVWGAGSLADTCAGYGSATCRTPECLAEQRAPRQGVSALRGAELGLRGAMASTSTAGTNLLGSTDPNRFCHHVSPVPMATGTSNLIWSSVARHLSGLKRIWTALKAVSGNETDSL